MTTRYCEELDVAIGVIRERYVANLGGLIEIFRNEIDRTRSDQDLVATLYSIRQHSHKINGLAPTLGLRRLGEFALQVEMMATELQNDFVDRGRLSEFFVVVEGMLDHMQELRC